MLFNRALEMKAKLGRDDVQVAVTLHEMGVCVREARRLGEAEMLFKRALEIFEANCPSCLHAARDGSLCAGGGEAGGGVRVV